MGRLSRGPIPDPTSHLPNRGSKSLSNCSQTVGDWRKYQWDSFGSTLAGCEVMPWTIVEPLPSPTWVNADRTQYVRSSSGLITTVVMTLFYLLKWSKSLHCTLSRCDKFYIAKKAKKKFCMTCFGPGKSLKRRPHRPAMEWGKMMERRSGIFGQCSGGPVCSGQLQCVLSALFNLRQYFLFEL